MTRNVCILIKEYYYNSSPQILKCQGYRGDLLDCVKPLSQGFKHVLGAHTESSRKENPPHVPQTPITLAKTVSYLRLTHKP